MDAKKKPRKPRVIFTDELKERFVALYQDGETITHAAADVGVSRRTIYLAEESDPQFAAALTAARNAHLENFRDALLSEIRAETTWQAKAWILERLFPEEFSRPQMRNVIYTIQPNISITDELINPNQ